MLIGWRREKQRRKFEAERRRKELEAEIMKLYEEDEDFREFLRLMEASARSKDSFSAALFQMIAAFHLEEVIKKHGWEREKFSKFLDEAERNREAVIRLALNLTKKEEGGNEDGTNDGCKNGGNGGHIGRV